MEFMWFQKFLTDARLEPAAYLVDVHDECEAIRKAAEIAKNSVPCTIVGLFALEDGTTVRAVHGWRKGESGRLQDLLPEEVKMEFSVTRERFDLGRPKPGDLRHLPCR